MGSFEVESVGGSTLLKYTLSEEEKLDSVISGMLENNEMEGILPVQILQVDEQILIRYNISGLTSLEETMQAPVDGFRLACWFEELMKITANAREYLMEEEAFVFDERYVYFNERGEMELLCLPVIRTPSPEQELLSFCRNMADHPNARCFLQVKEYLYSSGFSRAGFSQMLNEVKLQSKMKTVGSPSHGASAEIVLGREERSQSPEEGEKIGENSPVILSSGDRQPGEDGILFRPDIPPETGSPSGFGNTVILFHEEERPAEKGGGAEEGGVFPTEDSEEPTMDFPEEPTAILAPRAFLLRQSTHEKIEITNDEFYLGKGSVGVDHRIEGNPAVSRSHAKILCRGDNFYIVDVGSKNHTYVGGKRIEKQREYLLSDGIRVTLANEEFLFRLEQDIY